MHRLHHVCLLELLQLCLSIIKLNESDLDCFMTRLTDTIKLVEEEEITLPILLILYKFQYVLVLCGDSAFRCDVCLHVQRLLLKAMNAGQASVELAPLESWAQSCDNLDMRENLTKFHTLLFAHGNKPAERWVRFLKAKFESDAKGERWQELVDAVLSLLEAEYLESLKSFTGSKVPKLTELCRKRLYECVPNRNMAACVHSLPLPKPIKMYLLLGHDV